MKHLVSLLEKDEKCLQEKKEDLQASAVSKKGIEAKELLLKEKVHISSLEEGKKILEKLKRELTKLQKEGDTLEEKVSQSKKAYDILVGNQAENKRRLQELTVGVKEQEKAYQKALQENGFLEEQEYKSALLPPKEQAGRKKELEKYQLQVVECDTRLQSLKKQTEGKQEEELEKLLSQKEETR